MKRSIVFDWQREKKINEMVRSDKCTSKVLIKLILLVTSMENKVGSHEGSVDVFYINERQTWR